MKRSTLLILIFLLITTVFSGCQAIAENQIPATSSSQVDPTPSTFIETGANQTNEPVGTPSVTEKSTSTPRLTSSTLTQATDSVEPSITAEVSEYSSPQLMECVLDGCSSQAVHPFQYPLPPEYVPYVDKTYRYGSTQGGTRESHSGVEIPAALGTPVIAAAEGTVFYAGGDDITQFGRYKEFYGNLVILEHRLVGLDEPVYTLYAHLSSILVQTGDPVTAGQQIGNAGNSGATSGVHLHFEVRYGSPSLSSTTNPELWLQPLDIQPDPKNKHTETTGTVVVRLTEGGEPVASVPLKLEAYDEAQKNKLFYVDAESYALDAPPDGYWKENLVVGGLLPGTYRVSVVFNNQIYEKWVKISSELITLVEFDFAE